MRGLDIRAQYAFYKVVAGFDSEVANDAILEILMQAEFMGWNDCRAGNDSVPILFKDEVLLVAAWRNGRKLSSEMESMEACHCCNDGAGNPCHIHG